MQEEFYVSISNFMAYVHGTVNDMSKVYFVNERRYNYTTPKSFLELISLYAKLLKDKHKELTDRIERLENGLLKLADCASQVDGLQVNKFAGCMFRDKITFVYMKTIIGTTQRARSGSQCKARRG